VKCWFLILKKTDETLLTREVKKNQKMDTLSIIILSVLGLVGLVFSIAGFRRDVFKRKGTMKIVAIIAGLAFVAYSLVGLGFQFDLYTLPEQIAPGFLAVTGTSGGNVIITGSGGGGSSVSSVITYQPTASYSALNKYDATKSIGGTAYYQLNAGKFTTTAQTNVNEGESIGYWVSNSSYYIKPVIVGRALAGVNTVQALGYENQTGTVTLYDQTGKASTTEGLSNVSLGANGQANIEVCYQGTAKKSGGPFGGIVVAEFNSTIASLLCTGDNLLSTNPYHITYTVARLDNTFKTWAYAPSIDDGSGDVKCFNCQFLNGASAVGADGGESDTGPFYRFSFYPANYYLTNDGTIALDVEKFENQDTTRAGLGRSTARAFWG